MRNIKLTVEYDGTNFFGFQRQPDHPTIHEAMENALAALFNKKMKITSASGRTDTGVHARAQVVNFKTDSKMDLWQIQKGLNAHLPDEIAVWKVEEVAADFHARFSVKSKIYEYKIWNSRVRSPLLSRYVYQVPSPLNLVAMKAAAKLLTGKHDFRSFCTAEVEKDNTVRTISKITVMKKDNLIWLRFQADGFLYRMVRNLTSAIVEVGKGRLALEDLKMILKAKNRTKAGMAVPAHGLCLYDVKY